MRMRLSFFSWADIVGIKLLRRDLRYQPCIGNSGVRKVEPQRTLFTMPDKDEADM